LIQNIQVPLGINFLSLSESTLELQNTTIQNISTSTSVIQVSLAEHISISNSTLSSFDSLIAEIDDSMGQLNFC